MAVAGDDMLGVEADFGLSSKCEAYVDLRQRRAGFTTRQFSDIGGREDFQYDKQSSDLNRLPCGSNGTSLKSLSQFHAVSKPTS